MYKWIYVYIHTHTYVCNMYGRHLAAGSPLVPPLGIVQPQQRLRVIDAHAGREAVQDIYVYL